MVAKLDEAQELAVKPLASSWSDLSELLDADPSDDTRLRLRGVLARVIDKMHLLVVPRGIDRLAWLQIHFRGSDKSRVVRIMHRPPTKPRGVPKPGAWWAEGGAYAEGTTAVDLRDTEGVKAAQFYLEHDFRPPKVENWDGTPPLRKDPIIPVKVERHGQYGQRLVPEAEPLDRLVRVSGTIE